MNRYRRVGSMSIRYRSEYYYYLGYHTKLDPNAAAMCGVFCFFSVCQPMNAIALDGTSEAGGVAGGGERGCEGRSRKGDDEATAED